MKYITVLVSGDDYDEVFSKLEEKVNARIKEGYKPLGGVSIATTDFMWVSQAMIKED